MTREEAKEEILDYMRSDCYLDAPSNEACEIAVKALRPVSREQVEKVWSGMWIYDPDTGYAYCEMCKHTICQTDYLNGKLPPFCEMCGAPMTDEAVDMVMERLEALYGQENP